MSEFAPLCLLSEAEACRAIAAAVAEGVRAEPESAAGALIDRLKAAFGPIVQKIITLIESGVNDLPAILQDLATAGETVAPWVNVLTTILMAVSKQQ